MGKGIIELPPQEVYDSIRNPQLRFTYDNMLKVHVDYDNIGITGGMLFECMLLLLYTGIAYREANRRWSIHM